jgi:hypothetical protein
LKIIVLRMKCLSHTAMGWESTLRRTDTSGW